MLFGQGGILAAAVPFSIQYESAWMLMSFVLVAVNCFILITGYVYLNDARIPWPLQGHGWIALLGVLSFLFIILRFFFILCFLVTFLGHEFLFSILFLWIFDNCFEYEKLLWVHYSNTFQMLSLIFYIGVIINEILFN